jgi:soluble lytic murein transglycosylase-like protein
VNLPDNTPHKAARPGAKLCRTLARISHKSRAAGEGRDFSPAERGALDSLSVWPSAQFVITNCAEGQTGPQAGTRGNGAAKAPPFPVRGERSRLSAALVLLVLWSFASPLRASTPQMVVYTDQSGQCLVVTVRDPELSAAVAQGGLAAARRMVERRRESLPSLEEVIPSLGRRYGVDPALVKAIIEVESAWNPRARSRKGALGLMQLMPETAARFGVRRIFDPEENVTGGVRYLRFLLDRFRGDLGLTLAAYNAGEDAVASHSGIPPYLETLDYVRQVEAHYHESGSAASVRSIYARLENGRVVYVNY